MKEVNVNITWNDNCFESTIVTEHGEGLARLFAQNFIEICEMIHEYVDDMIESEIGTEDEELYWYNFPVNGINYRFCDMETMLKACTSYISLAAISRVTGINQTLLSHYANGSKKPRKKQRERIIAGIHKIGKILNGATYAYSNEHE